MIWHSFHVRSSTSVAIFWSGNNQDSELQARTLYTILLYYFLFLYISMIRDVPVYLVLSHAKLFCHINVRPVSIIPFVHSWRKALQLLFVFTPLQIMSRLTGLLMAFQGWRETGTRIKNSDKPKPFISRGKWVIIISSSFLPLGLNYHKRNVQHLSRNLNLTTC